MEGFGRLADSVLAAHRANGSVPTAMEPALGSSPSAACALR